MKEPTLNRTSCAYRRMMYAGFKIGEPLVLDKTIRISFECPCHTTEVHCIVYNADAIKFDDVFKNGQWDAALSIERAGAVSEDHLRADGFSEKDIRQIRYIYDLEDEVRKLRHVAMDNPNYSHLMKEYEINQMQM